MDKALPNYNNSEKHRQRQKLAEKVLNTGLFFNILLAAGKLTAGITGNSRALLADGVNSTSDVIYMIVVKSLVKISGKPADREHPYGHHQFENIAAIVVGAFIITTGIAIFWDSINSAFIILTDSVETERIRIFTLGVVAGTIIIKIMLMIQALSIGKKINNIAITAIALDHKNDIFSSLAATTGIIFGISGILWIDPLAGAAVSIIIAKTGIDILRESTADLVDTIPKISLDKRIREIIRTVKHVRNIESVNIHKFGPYFSLNITIDIDGNLTVYEGNKIADEIEELLMEKIELLRKVYIHYHPFRG